MDEVEEILGAPFDPSLVPDSALEPTEVSATGVGTAPALRRNRVRGMLLGGALGDALGAPHEFRNQVSLARYTGALEFPLWICRRFQGGRLTGSVGQTTDDTEMTIALAETLVQNHAYDRDKALMAYLAWANSRCAFLGYNTRKLLNGVKTVKGYQARWYALRAQPPTLWSQSNGCLMRCAPLAVLPEGEWRAAATLDCNLTNFHPVCVNAVTVYLRAARELLEGVSPAEATAKALLEASEYDVLQAVEAGRAQRVRDVTSNKGWVVHALYCAFLALNDRRTALQDKIDHVVRLSGDTDTNAAIAGSLLGILHGEEAMLAETRTGANLRTILECDLSFGPLARPERYTARRLMELAGTLANLG